MSRHGVESLRLTADGFRHGGKCGTLPIFPADVKARHDKMVEFTRRVMSDKRGTMSVWRDTSRPAIQSDTKDDY